MENETKPATRADVIEFHIGSLATATLEPLSDKPHGSDSRVILDARNVDQWGRTNGR